MKAILKASVALSPLYGETTIWFRFFVSRSPYETATLPSYPESLVMPSRKRKPAKVLGFSCTGTNSFCPYLQTTVDKGLDFIGWVWVMVFVAGGKKYIIGRKNN